MKRKNLLWSFLLVFGLSLLVFLPDSGLKADDRQIFNASTKPYIMFLLDNSGSMDTSDYSISADDRASFATYTLSASPTTTYNFSYTTSTDHHGVTTYTAKRITALKRVAIELLDVFRDDVKMGFSHFFYPPNVNYKQRVSRGHPYHDYVLQDATWTSGTTYPDGAVVRTAITDFSGSAQDASLISICNIVYNFTANGNTPLAESLDTVYGYFKGKINNTDGNTWTDVNGINRIPTGATPPPQYTCQNTYIILVSDGEPTDDRFDRGTVNNFYGTGATNYNILTTHSYDSPYTGFVASPTPNSPFDSNYKLYFKDNGMYDIPNVAKWMYEHPFAIPEGGPIPSQGISTWCVGMRLSGDGRTRLVNAADNNHGRGKYYDGDDYATLKSQLTTAIGSIVEQNYAFTSYTSPKKITTSGADTYLSYQGYFFNKPSTVSIWEGHLKCLEIVPEGTSYKFVEQWDTAAKLKAQGHAARSLWTQVPNQYDSGLGKFTYTSVEFKTTNQTALKKSLNAASDTESGTIIDYIRGNMTTRGITDPLYQYELADVFHSDIIYVGKPLLWKSLYDTSACDKVNASTDTDCYKKFYLTYEDRQKAVYVGTNDGVVHQVNANKDGTGAGNELSGFIPDELLPHMRNIAIDSYFTYTADGRMTATDIYSPANKWQTILVFGLREGGKAFYCRNISDPASTSFKWKFPDYVAAGTIASKSGSATITLNAGSTGTFAVGQYLVNETKTARTRITAVSGSVLTVSNNATFATADKVMALPSYAQYLGLTWCKPVIGRLKYKKGTTETETWVAIFTGGLGDSSNEEGKALFIVNADTGAPIWYLAHTSGSDSITADYNLKNSAALNYSIPQSLTAVDLNNDTFIDTIYFGNTGGHLFKLDLSDTLTTSWVPKQLFQGVSTQPIFLSPSVSFDQCYKLWLHFGSGNRNAPQASLKGQFIAIRDESATTYPLTTANLQQFTWTTAGLTETISATSDTTKKGWFFDLVDSGEILFDPDPFILPNGTIPVLYFNSYQPSTTVIGGDPCGTGGNMHLYSISLPYCASNGSFPITGLREDARISGGGLYGSNDYMMYVGTSQTGSITIKKFDLFTLQYPGGVFYFKEIIR
jgi:Tfp pilus tip-associated adhesin PilY1